uniref:G-protein coupled receptors family 1 profile domain-containing protein n=1 Tax=Erpetoichthys calabaricus TaxID=27687 RepID=A0A8C4X3H0_ERPCA
MTAKSEFLNSGVGYCYPDNNASCIKILRSAGVSALLYILSGTLVVVAIFGNLFVIIAVSHFRQLHTPTNFFVLSLAVADFLSGVLIMPVEFAAVIDYCWYLDDAVCPYHIMYGYFLLFVSVLNLVSISVDRYFAVCDPFFYNRNITNSAVGISIIFVWLFAFFFIYTFLFHTGGLVVTDFCIGMCVFYHYTHWWIVHHVITFLLPLLIVICLYTTIFITAMRHAKAIRSVIKERKNADSKKSKTSNSSERKAAKTLGTVVITFVILCSPYLCVGGCFFLHYTNWWIIDNLLSYLLPMLVIICLYTKIFIEARRHAKAINSVIKESQFPNERKSKSERKAARTLGIVVITFIILCSPFFVYFLVGLFFSISIVSILSVQTVILYLAAINCCIDPIIYGLFYPWFRKSLKMMVTLTIFKNTFIQWTGSHPRLFTIYCCWYSLWIFTTEKLYKSVLENAVH